MRGSLIPVKERLENDKIRHSIGGEFLKFGRKIPTISMKMYGLNKEIYVNGECEGEWCWIRIFEWPVGPVDNDGCRFACAIESRGNDIFSALVAYSLGRYFGEKIYDDAGYLEAGHVFGIDEFREKLQEKLNEKS